MSYISFKFCLFSPFLCLEALFLPIKGMLGAPFLCLEALFLPIKGMLGESFISKNIKYQIRNENQINQNRRNDG